MKIDSIIFTFTTVNIIPIITKNKDINLKIFFCCNPLSLKIFNKNGVLKNIKKPNIIYNAPYL